MINKPHITVVEVVYHSIPNEEPKCYSSGGYCYSLESDEQQYNRTLNVSKEWIKIDTGWLKEDNRGLIQIHNKSKENIIELSVDCDLICSRLIISSIPPEQSIRFYMQKDVDYLLHSNGDKTKCIVVVYPK